MNSLNPLIKNSGKIIKKTFKVATAVSKTEYSAILTKQRQEFVDSVRDKNEKVEKEMLFIMA
jgi:hypothetical protein